MSAPVRPPPIALDDLARPRFSGEARSILDLMSEAGAATSLEPDALMGEAVAETGLDDFGPDDFVPRLHVLCRSLREEARLNDAGVLAQAVLVTGLLRNRLLLEDLVGRHPEILDERVERPIVICGLPRTGTTHLHNLMSSDPALRSLPYWESMEPVLAERERPASGDPDPRWERTGMALSFLDVAMPEFKRMHEMTVDHVHEEIQLLAIDFSTMLFETAAPMPLWRDDYLARDQRPSYAYLKKILQALQWLRGGTRWVLKSPQHLEQLGPLLSTFPDATVVVTHRDPVAVVQSTITMACYGARTAYRATRPEWYRDYWTERIGTLLDASLRDGHLLADDRTVHVFFDQYMEDELGTLERVYDCAGIALTGQARADITGYQAAHPRGREGRVAYDLRRDFAVTPDEVRSRFGAYLERFPVRIEVR